MSAQTSSGRTARQAAPPQLRQGQGCALCRTVDADDLLQRGTALEDPVEHDLLAHDDLGPGVAEDEGELLGGGGVVDREAGRAHVHGGGVDQRELGAVAHHEGDHVAATHAQCVEPGREGPDPLVVLAPGHRDHVTRGSKRDRVGVDQLAPLESLADRDGRRCGHHSHFLVGWWVVGV
jgi:hypothetical protein